MAVIRVDIKAVISETEKLKNYAAKASKAANSITNIKRSIPDDIKAQNDLDNRINSVVCRLESISRRINAVKAYSCRAMSAYSGMEEYLNSEAKKNLSGLER